MKASICVLAAALLAAPAGQALSAPARPVSKAIAKAAAKPAAKVVAKPAAKTKTPAKKPAAKAKAKEKAPAKSAAHHKSHASVKAVSGQSYTSGHCRLTIPRGWSDYHGGKADPKDRAFNVTLGRAGDPKSMAATVKAMRGRVISDKADMVLMQVDLRRRDAKQYWVLTKPGPGCRATVTFSGSDQDGAARKIAQSLMKSR